MRAVIARIGNQAGIDAIHWRGGVAVYETVLRSHALVEHIIADGDSAGAVTLQTKGDQARDLLERLAGWIEFLSRIKVYKLVDVHLHPQSAREAYQDWWGKQADEDAKTVGKHLGRRKLHRIKNAMDGFINASEIADQCLNMLALVADTLTARSWDEFLANGFNDPSA